MRKFLIAFSVFAHAAILSAVCVITAPANAADLTAQQQQAIDKQIESYFIRNPEKLEMALDNLQVFMEARQLRQRESALRDGADQLYRNKADYTMGPDNAPITIVEFFDYNCGYCKRSFAPLMEVLRENKDVRVVFKEYPILGESSLDASRTALAIGDKLQYLTYHSKLMTHKGRINQAIIDKTLADMKLSPSDVAKKSSQRRFVGHLDTTRQLARSIGITGTPAFVINGTLFPGALDKGEMVSAIKQARADLKAR